MAGDSELTSKVPNPARVAAGRRNRALRRPVTAAGRASLRATALRFQPWRLSTGPRTAAGKARSSCNGKARQRGARSVRERRSALAGVLRLTRDLAALRRLAQDRRGLPQDDTPVR
jgi:hypothetical protein